MENVSSTCFPRVATDEIFLKHFPRVDRSRRKLGEDDEHAVRDVPARLRGWPLGEGKWPRYKFYCSFAARNCERVTVGN